MKSKALKKETNWLLGKSMVLLGMLFFMAACNEEETQITETPDPNLVAVEDDSYASETFDDVEDIVDDMAQSVNARTSENSVEGSITGDCGTVSIEQDENGSEIVVDFGEENCECADGKLRKGKIIASYSKGYWDNGREITYTFDQYHVDNHHVRGTKTITRYFENENSNRGTESKVDGSITLANEEGIISWKAERNRELLEGSKTIRRTDDVYQITGSSEGVSRDGQSFSSTINTPLIRKMDLGCSRAYVEGLLNINEELVIDYGDGTCNRWAMVTYQDKEYQVFLR